MHILLTGEPEAWVSSLELGLAAGSAACWVGPGGRAEGTVPLVPRSAGDLENQKQLEQIVWGMKEDERKATLISPSFHCTETGDWEP